MGRPLGSKNKKKQVKRSRKDLGKVWRDALASFDNESGFTSSAATESDSRALTVNSEEDLFMRVATCNLSLEDKKEVLKGLL